MGLALSVIVVAGALFALASTATAAIVPAVALGTSANYSVLGGSTVTNTGPSVLTSSLGLWPGTSVTGFPPGLVAPPAVTDNSNAAAQQAQADLTAAYIDVAGRPLDATTTADLAGLTLLGGVYAGPAKSALGLTGTLTLDAGGNPNTVFIFQTDSTLITGSDSTVSLVNGAQECNVFWQVGSSATLGTNSTFVGNILALTSIGVNTGVTVHGRTLARNGAVTLDDDTFTNPTCAQGSGSTTTTAVSGSTTTTAVSGSTTTTAVSGSTTTTALGSTTTTALGSTTTTVRVEATGLSTSSTGLSTSSTGVSTTTRPVRSDLPLTGGPIGPAMRVATLAIAGGLVLLLLAAVVRSKYSGIDDAG